MTKEKLREELEKIAWKHYDPDTSINVEEMLDEMWPLITSEAQEEKD